MSIISPEEMPIPQMKPKKEATDKIKVKSVKKQTRRPQRTERHKRTGRLAKKNPNLQIFKELEKHQLEDEIIDADERSPSPTARPDHPINKPNFFK